MFKGELLSGPRGRVVGMDSISQLEAGDAGAIVVSGSHGGRSSGELALEQPLRLVVFNDAGIGRDEAGIAALALHEAAGRAALTVSHHSARIGDACDGFEHGVVSRCNGPARALGLIEGQALREQVSRLIGVSD